MELRKLIRPFIFLALLSWVTAALCANDINNSFPDGALVVVIVAQFPPTVMEPADSGYTKRLIIHPGKRGKSSTGRWIEARHLS